MPMTSDGPCLKVDGELSRILQAAVERLDGAHGELVLDFSAVGKVDAGALQVMKELADLADDKGIRVVLGGVRLDIYKVLKLMKLAPRFSFAD